MKFFVHKLGCPKNDVDADYISARLIFEGHEPVKKPEDAESIIVNTCGFILPAQEESINEILRLADLKKSGRLKTLYAAGCLSQRHGDEMLKEMPELDGAFGLGAVDSIAKAVTGSTKNDKVIKMEARKLGYLSWNNRFIDSDDPYAYLKISDGCDRGCTYCAIPGMRGKFRSRPLDSIIREAEYLAENGKKELILVSQEATLYGYNYKGPEKPDVITLLEELDKVKGVEWIRLMYLYPHQLDQRMIEYITDPANKTLNYFDLPLQHINDEILTGMNRRVTRKQTEDQLAMIRNCSNDAIIRTTFIVGFPGETDAQFEELNQFVADFRFDRLGVFAYSQEEDTPAALLPNQIDEAIKQERADIIMTTQLDIAFEKNNSLIDTIQNVIIDSVNDDGSAVGRSYADCPEVDLDIAVTGENLKIGDILPVKITSVEGYDLFGQVVNNDTV